MTSLTPESQSTATVLYDEPLKYNPKVHIPPFLRLASLRVKASHTAMMIMAPSFLSGVVAYLRSLSLAYHTLHWQALDYSDHLLFERLYESVTEEVDGVGERVVGLQGPDGVELESQTRFISSVTLFVDGWLKQGAKPAAILLALEHYFQDIISQLLLEYKSDPGTSNLLEGIADNHMQHIYLLQQRCIRTT